MAQAKKKTTRTQIKRKTKPKKKPEMVSKFVDFQGFWTPIGANGTGFGGTYDAFGTQPEPSPVELVAAFTDTVYACSTLIATSLADIEIKLCAETHAGYTPTRRSAPTTGRGMKWYRKKAAELHEILNHPVIDLLQNPNPDMSYEGLMTATDLYQEIVGRAFWLLTFDDLDALPVRIDVLPAHQITTKYDDETGVLLGYQLGDEHTGKFYEPHEVIPFRNYEYFDLKTNEGISPAKAVWQKIQLSFKELSSWEIITTQMAQPFVMISSKDPDVPITADNAERIAKEFTARFWQGGKGGVYVNSESVDVNPLSWPPKDQAGLALQDNLKSSICNAFHVPRALLDMQDVSQANGNNSITLFQRHCLKPRINHVLDIVNKRLVSLFDDRLFLVAENVVAKDEAMELQKKTFALSAYTAGGITKNEFRHVLDLAPVQGGDQFNQPNTPTPFQIVQGGEKVAKSAPEDKYDPYPLKPLVGVLKKWFAKQREYVLSQTKSAEFVTKTAPLFDLSRFDRGMADDLFPVVWGYYEESARKFASQVGLTDDVWDVIQPKLAEAVRTATFRFAESTNKTTAYSIDEARARLRQELEAGLIQGDTTQELTKRVQAVFGEATEERAWLIADTERTRAISSAELVTAKASGVVGKKVWLADSQACDVCKSLNGQRRDLDDPYFVDPSRGKYAVCDCPPGHPGCRCSQTYELKD